MCYNWSEKWTCVAYQKPFSKCTCSVVLWKKRVLTFPMVWKLLWKLLMLLRMRFFSSFCESAGEDHNEVLYHSEMRWLSCGSVIGGCVWLTHSYSYISSWWSRSGCTFQTQYLAHKIGISFGYFLRVEQTMQGSNAHVIQLCDKNGRFSEENTEMEWSNIYIFPTIFPSAEFGDVAVLSTDVKHWIVSGKYFFESLFWTRDVLWGRSADVHSSAHKNVDESRFWIYCQKDFPQLAAEGILNLWCDNGSLWSWIFLLHLSEEQILVQTAAWEQHVPPTWSSRLMC